ncbi:MAG: DM13 domain-containing protein [Goleter apudmare HA4340-LM2]|jgi:hypothetical protein|nr:DM13 domain-containing protein [Goleter apudmare HA4340-LM2]
MKFRTLVIVGIIATVSFSCAKETTSNQTDTQTQSVTNTASPVVAEPGAFKPGEHPTQGKVSVVTEQGKSYLEFDGNFKTDNGPDLFVILHRSDAPPISGIKEKDYVSIARLQKTSGNQRYALPDNVKLGDFKSVAIWCRQFNATFGYATL